MTMTSVGFLCQREHGAVCVTEGADARSRLSNPNTHFNSLPLIPICFPPTQLTQPHLCDVR